MKEVSITSMQRIFNYGSSLQAYALRRMIEDVDPAAHVSFTDFHAGRPLVAAPTASRAEGSGLARSLAKVREYSAVNARATDKLRFFNHKRGYARKYFPSLGIPVDPNYDLDVDLQVIGSDEVFNCVQSNSNVGYSRDLFGHDSPAKSVVSYAASFGNTTLEKIDAAGIRSDLAEDLSRFDAISVRDGNSANIVEALTGTRPPIHVDPVIAYDYMGREAGIPTARPERGKYVIVYGYSGRLSTAENSEARRYAAGVGARILTFGGVQECGDRFIDCSPFDLLTYFRDADAVITDTFHGTILAIINHVPFASITRKSANGYGNEEKLSYLLGLFGLGSRRLPDPSRLGQLLDEPVDFGPVDSIIARERERSMQYLRSAVRGSQKHDT